MPFCRRYAALSGKRPAVLYFTAGEPLLKEIKSGAFWGCYGIKKLVIPDNVKTIEENAFRSLTGCVEVKFGAGIESIGIDAFKWSSILNTVTIDSQAAVNLIKDATCSGTYFIGQSCANTIYIKDGLSTSSATYLTSGYQVKNSDRAGYVKWEKISG